MKKHFFVAFAILASLPLFSQTTNYALQNTNGAGNVLVSGISELNQSQYATLQLWIKPTTLGTVAKLIEQDNLSVWVNANSTLSIKSGVQSANINYTLIVNNWVQMTVVYSQGTVRAFINNVEQTVTGSLPAVLPNVTSNMTIGSGFIGQIDEIRIWNKALVQADFYWRNTMNKYNPNIASLVAYWKCDQEQCANLVDYQFKHHGIITGLTMVAVTDNASFRYRIVTGYTNFMRFTDRPNINRDMFLMTNDVILLSAAVQDDGSVLPELSDNSAVATNVNYLSTFQGHNGVMSFTGTGSQMLAADGHTLFDPTAANNYGAPITASVGLWIYIDTWNPGAVIISKNQDAANCLTVKLGPVVDSSIVVNFCGTVATLTHHLTAGKWHYLGVYLRPVSGTDITSVRASYNLITIGVDYTEYTGLTGVTLSGTTPTTKSIVPLMPTTPIYIGQNFAGKMDEIMLWGTLRNGVAQNDAEKGYQWNVGNWNNIFLNSYWKGDDPTNIGKDSQSMPGIIAYMKNYYTNYRGAKVRMGIIFHGASTWQTALSSVTGKTKVDLMIAGLKTILSTCDGLDLDLEWSYSASDYATYNNIVSRIANEVMAGTGKTFTTSLHYVSYGIDKTLIPKIDYFTFQMYGPQTASYTYQYYTDAYNAFVAYGFPKNKILLSYGVLLVDGTTEKGYKDLFDQMGMNDTNYDPNVNIWSSTQTGGVNLYFNGVNQVKTKQNVIVDNDLKGTMYFDMANDQKMSDYKSLIRAQNEIISANVDTLITSVNVSGIITTSIPITPNGSKDLATVYVNSITNEIEINIAESKVNEPVICQVYSPLGILIKEVSLNTGINNIYLKGLGKGMVLIKVSSRSYSTTQKVPLN